MPSRTLSDAGCDVKRADCVALALQCRMIAESLSPANGFLVSASACEQIRSTRIAGVSDHGETTLFDYADYQVAGSLETLRQLFFSTSPIALVLAQMGSENIATLFKQLFLPLADLARVQLVVASGTVKQREDAEKAIQTAHQQGKSIRKIARDLGIPWRKANKLLNT